MPYKVSICGNVADSYDSIYIEMSKEPLQLRDCTFSKLSNSINFYNVNTIPDIRNVDSKYLINAINQACDTWIGTTWEKDYDKSIFFEYVLPYRIYGEQISDWRALIAQEYPYLNLKSIRSSRGQYYEAESAGINNTSPEMSISASNGRIVSLGSEGESVTFMINSPRPSRKIIYVRYSTTSRNAKVELCVNGKFVGWVKLKSTNTFQIFKESPVYWPIELRAGDNELIFKYGEGTVGLDNIMVMTEESMGPIEDFSNDVYRIKNMSNGKYVVIDNLDDPLLIDVKLKALKGSRFGEKFRLDYKGFGCWSISHLKRDSTNLCIDGNCIEIGDEYELMYWHDCIWKSFRKETATNNVLVFDNVPKGGLYVVRNLSKGHEERIFTYEDGKQVWW